MITLRTAAALVAVVAAVHAGGLRGEDDYAGSRPLTDPEKQHVARLVESLRAAVPAPDPKVWSSGGDFYEPPRSCQIGGVTACFPTLTGTRSNYNRPMRSGEIEPVEHTFVASLDPGGCPRFRPDLEGEDMRLVSQTASEVVKDSKPMYGQRYGTRSYCFGVTYDGSGPDPKPLPAAEAKKLAKVGSVRVDVTLDPTFATAAGKPVFETIDRTALGALVGR